MKRIMKIIMVLIMLLGISLSIFNFFSVEIKAAVKNGVWVYVNDDKECMDYGSECVIGDKSPQW